MRFQVGTVNVNLLKELSSMLSCTRSERLVMPPFMFVLCMCPLCHGHIAYNKREAMENLFITHIAIHNDQLCDRKPVSTSNP